MEVNLKLSQEDGEPLEDPTLYKRMIGKLLYLMITRPYISYSVNHLSQFLASPKIPHFKATQRILWYVKSTPSLGLFFASNSDVQLQVYAEVELPRKGDV